MVRSDEIIASAIAIQIWTSGLIIHFSLWRWWVLEVWSPVAGLGACKAKSLVNWLGQTVHLPEISYLQGNLIFQIADSERIFFC